ncbi:MAG: hypothetical protein MI919_28820 [Holophagales bacterium]|nr:hypothetical protein [Holophagales bacterium]
MSSEPVADGRMPSAGHRGEDEEGSGTGEAGKGGSASGMPDPQGIGH